MNYVGIDWADEKHDICILSQDGQVVSEFDIKHNGAGFEQLQAVLLELGDVSINIERPDGLLVSWLDSQGWSVFVTAPTEVASRRSKPDKNDRGDARLLAELLRQQYPECRPLTQSSQAVRELRSVVQAYDQLQKEQLRVSNQLRDVLKQYYPVANDLFSKLHQPLTLAFLQAFPSPQTAQVASLEELSAFFVAQKYRWMSKVADKYALLQTPMPVHPTPAGLVTHMLALVAVLQTLTAQLSQLKRQIHLVLQTHPEADWWLSLPGSGPLTAARLLAYIGDNRDRFPSAQTLQVYGGTVPVTQQSGKRVRVFFRQNCHHALRDAITDLAANSCAKSGWALSYYRSQRALGHDHTRAIRALANRWFKIIWTIWQRHEAYDEAFHVANRSQRGLPRPIAA